MQSACVRACATPCRPPQRADVWLQDFLAVVSQWQVACPAAGQGPDGSLQRASVRIYLYWSKNFSVSALWGYLLISVRQIIGWVIPLQCLSPYHYTGSITRFFKKPLVYWGIIIFSMWDISTMQLLNKTQNVFLTDFVVGSQIFYNFPNNWYNDMTSCWYKSLLVKDT